MRYLNFAWQSLWLQALQHGLATLSEQEKLLLFTLRPIRYWLVETDVEEVKTQPIFKVGTGLL